MARRRTRRGRRARDARCPTPGRSPPDEGVDRHLGPPRAVGRWQHHGADSTPWDVDDVTPGLACDRRLLVRAPRPHRRSARATPGDARPRGRTSPRSRHDCVSRPRPGDVEAVVRGAGGDGLVSCIPDDPPVRAYPRLVRLRRIGPSSRTSAAFASGLVATCSPTTSTPFAASTKSVRSGQSVPSMSSRSGVRVWPDPARAVDAPHLRDRAVPELGGGNPARVVVHPLPEHHDGAAAGGAIDPVVRLGNVLLHPRARSRARRRRVDLGREVPPDERHRQRDGRRAGDRRRPVTQPRARQEEERDADEREELTTFSTRPSGQDHSRSRARGSRARAPRSRESCRAHGRPAPATTSLSTAAPASRIDQIGAAARSRRYAVATNASGAR